jgi:putative aminopeptidase FrvX
MNQSSLQFLEHLSDLPGPSGFEREVVLAIRDHVRPHVDGMATDKMGSLVFTKKGSADAPTILLPGHIDEIGFVITSINDDGCISFNNLGYWSEYTLAGQRVQLMTRRGMVRGVIVAPPPPHAGDKNGGRPTMPGMQIDIGASNREEVVEMGVRPGDAVVPESKFFTAVKPRFRNGNREGERALAFGKALDNRIGAYLAAELMRTLAEARIDHPNTLVGAATVQEEVDERGARTIANMVRPDLALVLDVDMAGDVPGMTPQLAPSKMGEGVTITVWDSYMIPNQPLKELCIRTCEEKGIPHQLSYSKGGTDAGSIHMSNIGVPSIVLGPPVRHIHTHVGIVDLADVEATLRLLIELVQVLDKKTVESMTSIGGLKCGL